MDRVNANKIEEMLPENAVVVDVGGGVDAFARADWVIDALSFDQRRERVREARPRNVSRCCRKRWVQVDLCQREKWPFEDKQFDFAVCSHVLEDVRDPVWVCSEISRIAKAGYIETPSRVVEQSAGIEHPRLAGYYHHRWLVSVNDGELEFRQKPHLLHATRDAIVAKVGFWRTINPQYHIETLFWDDELTGREVLEFDESKVVDELCQWAGRARRLPDLLVEPAEPLKRRLHRAWYFFRLRFA